MWIITDRYKIRLSQLVLIGIVLIYVMVESKNEIPPHVCVNLALVKAVNRLPQLIGNKVDFRQTVLQTLTGNLRYCYAIFGTRVYDHTAEFLPVRANMIGDAQQGTKILQDWTELHPSDFLARVELAGLLGQKGDRTKSLAIYRELNFGWALYQMGYNAMAHKQLRQAFEYLSMAVDLEPELVEARQALSEAQQDYALSLYRLGSNAREHGQIENAIEYLYMAVEVKPTFTEARFTLAEIQYDLGSPEAENNYLIAAETCVAPELCADIQSRLGDLKSSEGDLDGAFSYYRLALQIWPDHWSAMIGIGQLYLRQGDKPEAIRWAFQALAVSPGNKWALRLLDESK